MAIRSVNGGVIASAGFSCAGVRCGIKSKADALDLGLILSERAASAAAVFTTNRAKAAPVLLNQQRIRGGRMRGVVVNAGNANACTGERGMDDAKCMVEIAARCTRVTPEDFLVASTGIIGHPLPMDKVKMGIRVAAKELGRTLRHARAFVQAIMTTDTCLKSVAVETTIGRRKVRIGGAAKGSGMIAPNMATMLAFVTSDCAIGAPMLRKALRDCANDTFNCVTVDGDCSTNDTLAVLANGAAGNPPIRKAGKDYELFRAALHAVCEDLAKAMARDGEGATRFVEVCVTGGRSHKEADAVARKIANSPLVKTAIHGGDPNWGRIICAAGYAGEPVEPEKMKLSINGTRLFRHGVPCRVRADRLAACMKRKDILISLDLGRGTRSSRIWTCDFSREYVTINADYHT